MSSALRHVGRRRAPVPLVLAAALLAAYLVVPVGAFVVRLARAPSSGFSSPGLLGALWVSVETATITTALVGVLGVPLAYLLARSRSRVGELVGALVQLPLAVPPVMSGILLVYLVGPYTLLGRLSGGRLTESLAGVVLAQSFVASPFLVVAARSAFRGVDPALSDMAATLGRGELRRFFTVALPVAGDGIAAGMLLAWLRAFGEFGATVILAYHPYTLPVYTDVQFSGSGLQLTSAPTLLALAVAAAILLAARSAPSGWRALSGRRRASGLAADLPPPVPLSLLPRRPGPARSASASRAEGAVPAVPGSRASIRVRVELQLGELHLDVAADAPSGRLAILGPSGSGKSATLRCVAGLVGGASTSVRLGERELSGLAPEQRPLGYVAQGLALFPHLDVWRQVTFGLGADRAVASSLLARFGVADLAARRPEQLSGGERQRVRLAQALARSPRLLLLDEPLSALDVPVRAGLRAELRSLQRNDGLSTVLVTHDPSEAAMLADDLVVISGGRVLQAGRRGEVFTAPDSAEVALLLGWVNVFAATVLSPGLLGVGGAVLELPTGLLEAGSGVEVGVQPDAVELAPAGQAGTQAVLEEAVELGSGTELAVRLGELVLRVPAAGRHVPVPGAACSVRLDPRGVRLWQVIELAGRR